MVTRLPISALQEIGERVRNLRAQAGLTQDALAATVGQDKSAISHLEGGRRMPHVRLVLSIALALDCTLEDILGNREDWVRWLPV